MATIVLADDGIRFDGRTPSERPLGGVESAVVALVEELARRGHRVSVHNNCAAPLDLNGVRWRPIRDGTPETADLYIANRGDRLLRLVPRARRVAFWTHNPCRYLLKARYLWKLAWRRPTVVFIGRVHAATYPAWATAGGRKVIPYGLADLFCEAGVGDDVPAPRAVFTSNPLWGLDWLLDVWVDAIRPRVPAAELHLFTGAATYGSAGETKTGAMARVLARAEGLADRGVRLRGPVPKPTLVEEFRRARCMLYHGDENETFCLALGEAQAMGVPAVVTPRGSVVERVVDGETGFITGDGEAFALAAVRLLTDDALWSAQHRAALAKQRAWRWPQAAAAFEELLA